MTKMMRWALGGALVVTVLGGPSTALAAGQATGGGAGCKANGQAVATAAQTVQPFGRVVVKSSAPIANDVAAFKAALCGPPAS